jgi:hypothetical protein
MRFNSEEAAFDYWEEAYYFSGGGYEGPGVNFDGRVSMFKDWVADHDISWLSREQQAIIGDWNNGQ